MAEVGHAARLQELQALTDVALAHLELDELLGSLLERTCGLLDARVSGVLLVDDLSGDLILRAAVGMEEAVERDLRIPAGHGFAGRVAVEGRPLVADVEGSDVMNPVLREKGITSLAGVPLIVSGSVVGVLQAGVVAPRTFKLEDLELLQLVADRAALRIEHARLYEAERRSRRRIEHMQAITDAALAHLEVTELLAVLLPRIREILDVDTCAVLLLDEVTNELVARAADGIEEEVEEGVRIPVGKGFAGRVAGERRPVVLDDIEDADVVNPVLHEKGIRSMLGVPLLVGGGVIGVLHVGTLGSRAFAREDVDLLQIAADRAAIAIEHARLFEAEREARQRIERVQAVTDAALAHLELEELLAVLLPRIRSILGADTCAVLLRDPETDELVARAAVGIEEEVEQGVRIPYGGGFAGRVAAGRQPVILDDLDYAHVLNPILRQKGIRSMLGVPLLVGEEAIGVLHVGTLKLRKFTPSDSELLQLVADRVALAIERARIHEETVMLDQLKLNFVAIASHELRTPATSVYGVLSTLVHRSDQLPEETKDMLLHSGYEQAERLRRLLEELLDLSRLDASAIRLDPRPVVLGSVLARIVGESVPNPTDVRLSVPDDLAAMVDVLVLDRVLSNLLVNAVRYGAPPFHVSAEQRDRHLRIAVEDAGSGVPEELRPRLFERFARGVAAQGSGLGLAIARSYARAHGGDLVYEPQATGARFELILPQQ